MHQLTAESCNDGPCPELTEDKQRHKTGGQGYLVDPSNLSPTLTPSEPDEVRWEMDTDVFERLLAGHLTDDAIARILAMRRTAERAA